MLTSDSDCSQLLVRICLFLLNLVIISVMTLSLSLTASLSTLSSPSSVFPLMMFSC